MQTTHIEQYMGALNNIEVSISEIVMIRQAGELTQNETIEIAHLE